MLQTILFIMLLSTSFVHWPRYAVVSDIVLCPPDVLSDMMMKTSALLNSRTLKKERYTIPKLEEKHR